MIKWIFGQYKEFQFQGNTFDGEIFTGKVKIKVMPSERRYSILNKISKAILEETGVYPNGLTYHTAQ